MRRHRLRLQPKHIMQRVTGKSVHQFSQENVFRPLGMRETGYLPPVELKKRAAPTADIVEAALDQPFTPEHLAA